MFLTTNLGPAGEQVLGKAQNPVNQSWLHEPLTSSIACEEMTWGSTSPGTRQVPFLSISAHDKSTSQP
jgi:hypothetical protein